MFSSFGIGIRLDGFTPQDTGPSGPTFRRLRGTVSNTQVLDGSLTTELILTAGRSPSGYIGYSSFEDDAFGDVTFPSLVLPDENKPLLALMSLPGGGDYVVFDMDARDDIAGQKVVVGEHEAIFAEADLISYNGTNLRTQIVYLDEKFAMVEGVAYPLEVTPHIGELQALDGDIVQTSGQSARLSIAHNLGADLTQINDTIGHLYPPVTLRAGSVQTSVFDGHLTVAQHLAGFISQTGTVVGDLFQNNFRRLSGSIIQTSPITADLTRTPLLTGTIQGGGELVGATDRSLRGTMQGGGELVGAVEEAGDPAANAIINAMSTPPTEAHEAAIRTLVDSLKTAGVWSKLDRLLIMRAATEQQALLDWKLPSRSGVNNNGLGFTPNLGFVRSGSTQNISIPFPGGENFAIAAGSLGVYAREPNGALDGGYFDTTRTSGGFLGVRLRSNPDVQVSFNDATASLIARTAGTALYSIIRNGDNKIAYKGGTSLGSVSVPSTALPSGAGAIDLLIMGAYSYHINAVTASAAYIGGYLDATEVANLNSAISAFMATDILSTSAALRFVGAATPVYNTAGFNLTVHPDTLPGDLLILVKASGGNDNPTISGWTGIGGSNFHVGGGADPNGIGVNCSYRVATEPGQVIPIGDSGGHNEATVLTFRNADESIIGFSSTNYQAAGGTNIVAPGSAAFSVGDLGMFIYAGRGTMASPSVDASANWANEAIVTNISNAAVSMAIAIAEVDAASTKTFLTGQWTGSATHRVAVVLRVRP